MEGDNPFDIAGRDGGPVMTGRAAPLTEEEKAKKLEGYFEIDPEYWAQVKYGTHVRYETKKDGFRPGGFVMKNPLDAKGRDTAELKRFIKLANGFNAKARDYAEWLVAYEDLAALYIKPDAGVLMVMKSLSAAVRGLNDNIRRLATYSKELEARIAALESRK